MIATIGKTFLDGGQFTTDPSIDRDWPPRRSRMRGIGGSTTQHDFGRFARDMRLTLSSQAAAPASNANYINHAFKIAIESKMLSRLQVFSYSDYTGIEGTVIIRDFVPRATFIRDGIGVLWEYTLILDVMTLTKLDFETYSGS